MPKTMTGKTKAPMAMVRPALEVDAPPVVAGGWLLEGEPPPAVE